jgi:hypothetical protein
MKSILAAITICCAILGCSQKEDTNNSEHIATTRIDNLFDSIRAYLVLDTNLNTLARTNWQSAISTMTSKDPVLKELLTTKAGGYESIAMLSTNAQAWIHPEEFSSEIAIILAEAISKGDQRVFLAKRFNGSLVYYTSVPLKSQR